jgi:hypothetical protein
MQDRREELQSCPSQFLSFSFRYFLFARLIFFFTISFPSLPSSFCPCYVFVKFCLLSSLFFLHVCFFFVFHDQFPFSLRLIFSELCFCEEGMIDKKKESNTFWNWTQCCAR